MAKAKPGTGLRSLIKANEALATGMAKAVQRGYEEFEDALDAGGDPSQPGFDNPLLKGSLAGWLAALDETVVALQNAANELIPGAGAAPQAAPAAAAAQAAPAAGAWPSSRP